MAAARQLLVALGEQPYVPPDFVAGAGGTASHPLLLGVHLRQIELALAPLLAQQIQANRLLAPEVNDAWFEKLLAEACLQALAASQASFADPAALAALVGRQLRQLVGAEAELVCLGSY